ncbi:adenosine receptor A1-like [Acropora muricata]|uniref:adenosine receptor A1-like n=1 Tax=Acropora muricata TaxID=159855 RepID=UPI0034E5E82C
MANHSQQQNITTSFHFFSSSECIAWLTVFGMEAVAIVMLNALAIIVYLKERSLRKRSMYLVVNQAVADMLVAGCVINNCLFLGGHCKFWTSTISSILPSEIVVHAWFLFTTVAAVTNLAAISLERMHATFRPFKHRIVKKKMFGAAVATVWIKAGFCSGISVLTVYSFTIELSSDLLKLLYLTFFLFCLLIMVVSYSSIVIKTVCGNQPHHHGVTGRERKLTKTLFIVTFVSLLLTLPLIILRILFLVSSHTFIPSSLQTSRLIYSFEFSFWANSLVNPICYAFKIPEFRRALFSILRLPRFLPLRRCKISHAGLALSH